VTDTQQPLFGEDVDPVSDAAAELNGAGADSQTSSSIEPDPLPVEVPGDHSRSPMRSGTRAFFDWLVVVGIALLVAILVRTFLLAHFVVDGDSMKSTLATGDRVFVNKMSYRLHDPNRGDVVVLHEITGSNERDLIKRVIALPGEEIEIQNCVVRIDDLVLIEPYLDPAVVTPSRCGVDQQPIRVPEDHVFVMGDNRPGSSDSRTLGPIPRDDLVGRAFVVFWPRANWQWL
jgi:signal peptidase I